MTSIRSPLSLLEVFLNGGRSYVQGTQMIARSAEHLADEGRGTTPSPELQTAVFHRITNRLVGICRGDQIPERDSADDLVAKLQFRMGNNAVNLHVIEMEENAPRKDLPVHARWSELDGARTGPLSSAYEIRGLQTGEDFLVSIVQIVKAEHEGLADDVHDVWFTGIRGCNVPMAGPLLARSGVLDLLNLRVLQSPTVWQTLQRVTFTPSQSTQPELHAVVTFSFKSKELQHVN